MNTRIAIVVMITVSAALLVASSVTAQPTVTPQPEPLPIHMDNIWHTLAITRYVYLPLIQSYYPPCTRLPTLISPTNGSLLTTLVPTLVYMRGTAPVTQSTIYIADNAGFNSPIVYGTSGGMYGPFSLKMFDNLEPATRYYWRVRDQCGTTYSPYSSVFTFTTGSGGVILPAPTLKSPVSGTVGLIKPITLTWYSVAGAVGYQLYYSKAGSGGNTLLDVGGTSYVMNFPSANTTYEWWVVPYNSYAYGAASPRWRFTTGTFALTLPAKIWPMPDRDPVVSHQGNIYRSHAP